MPEINARQPKNLLKMNKEQNVQNQHVSRHSSNEMLVACADEEIKCYIAGKISGLPKDEYRAKFEEAKKEVKELGFEPVCPIDLPHNHGETWHEYMKECLIEMLKCQKVYALYDWDMSSGARIEIDLANKIGIEVINQQIMKKVRISIANESGFWDDDLWADIVLPSIPNINENLNLTRDVLDGLEYRYTKLSEQRKKDYEKWMYGRGIGFDDAIYVYAIRYVAGRDYVDICLDSRPYSGDSVVREKRTTDI